jgi:hypothetical protein
MVPIKVRLSDFTSKKKYLNLQLRFLQFCEKLGGPHTELDQLKPNDFEIFYKEQTDYNEEEYHNLSFHEFVQDQIFLISDRALLQLNREVKKMDLVRKDELKRFVDKKLKALENIRAKIIETSKILDPTHVDSLHTQINILIEKIDSKEFEKGLILDKRIKFNWHQNDLLVLISLLRENGHIDLKNTLTETGLAIDQVFAFKNSKTKKYQNYSGSRHELEKVKREGIMKSINRLKKVFNEDFFNSI